MTGLGRLPYRTKTCSAAFLACRYRSTASWFSAGIRRRTRPSAVSSPNARLSLSWPRRTPLGNVQTSDVALCHVEQVLRGQRYPVGTAEGTATPTPDGLDLGDRLRIAARLRQLDQRLCAVRACPRLSTVVSTQRQTASERLNRVNSSCCELPHGTAESAVAFVSPAR